MARRAGVRRGLTTALLGAAAALLGAAGTALFADIDPAAGVTAPFVLLIGFVALGVASCWVAFTLFDGHFDDLERLRAAVVALDPAVDRPAALPQADDEAGRLAAALSGLAERARTAAAAPDRRLTAVIGALDQGLLAVTDSGLVSLANGAAGALLGADRVAVGTSVFDALERDALAAVMAQARDRNRAVTARLARVGGGTVEARVATLGDRDGAVLTFTAPATEARPGVAHDLRLHDRPPPPPPLADGLALDDLPVLVLDTETTGLDVASDRIVAIGAVRLHGARVYPSASFDRLVRPDRPIPPGATRIHGITDAMVAGAERFAAVWPDLAPLLDGCVLVGHNIGFDRALLARHCAEAGLAWPDPPSLCTGHLAAALDPGQTDLNLEAVAARFGIPVAGRHTAFGDALLAAALYVKLVALMTDAGVATLGAARALAARPKHLWALQKGAGW